MQEGAKNNINLCLASSISLFYLRGGDDLDIKLKTALCKKQTSAGGPLVLSF